MTESDGDIANLVQQILGQRPSAPDLSAPDAEQQLKPDADPPVDELAGFDFERLSSKNKQSTVAVEASPQAPEAPAEVQSDNGTARATEKREIKTASELATMIEADLAGHPGCPRDGFRVTVYGSTLWRAMLTITPAAGPIRNPQKWRDLTEELADRLRKRYDLDWR